MTKVLVTRLRAGNPFQRMRYPAGRYEHGLVRVGSKKSSDSLFGNTRVFLDEKSRREWNIYFVNLYREGRLDLVHIMVGSYKSTCIDKAEG